jgi:hypothetical protein
MIRYPTGLSGTSDNATIPTASAGIGHNILAVAVFELVGVGLLAVVADTSEQIGNLIVVLMVAFLFFWLITNGSKFFAPIIGNVGKMTSI